MVRRVIIHRATPALGMICALAWFTCGTLTATPVPRVQAIRFWSFGDVTRIAIQLDGKYKLRSDQIQHPFRLYFDLAGVRAPVPSKRNPGVIHVNDARVKQIRTAQVSAGTTRIVLDLETPVDVVSSQLVNPERLILEIRPKHNQSAPNLMAQKTPEVKQDKPDDPGAQSSLHKNLSSRSVDSAKASPDAKTSDLGSDQSSQPGVTSSDATPVVPLKSAHLDSPVPGVGSVLDAGTRRNRAPAPRPNVQAAGSPVIQQATNSNAPAIRTSDSTVVPNPAVAALSNKNHPGDRSLVRLFGLKLGRVVIDAGHGGHDTGTIGANGLLEKDLVLDVALRLGALVSSQMGADVVYTRSSDVFIPLEDRTKIANDQKADLFISIHANSSPEASATGVETYYFNLTSDRSGLKVATRENASSTSSISDLNDLLHRAVLQAKLEESREFAQSIQVPLWGMSVRMNNQSRNRGVRQAPFVVLIGATMPSILAEVGFISNPHDARLLMRTEQRQKVAEALFKGISKYASSLSHTQLASNSSR
jgi:N-acetylmuramoyl-L-alanine amidase